ncbi:hypothetical protein F4859DRAFT_518760 [Xylaria cf. heliscus]|nr:hypothetical protein F4859DRAFT_518760 [Xylaria cf. heliscus]
MRFKIVVLPLFVALAAASRMDDLVSQMPSCARKCLDEDSKNAGCDIDDYRCQCTKIQEINNSSTSCISTSCSSDDQNKATQITTEICLDIAHEVDTDTSGSAMHSLAGVVGPVFASITSAVGPEFTSAAGAASDLYTSATADVGDTFTSATAVVGGVYASATAVVGGVFGSPVSTQAAAHQVTVSMGIVGAAAVFAFAL